MCGKLFKPYLVHTGSIFETNTIHEWGYSESFHPKINGAKPTKPGAGILGSMGLDSIIFDADRYIAMIPLSVGLPYGKNIVWLWNLIFYETPEHDY